MSKNNKRKKWNRAHEFSKRKPTKLTSGHPAYIYGKFGRQRKYLAFTHSPTTKGLKNEKLKVNIDGSNEPCYLRTTPLYAWDVDFEKGPFNYAFHSEQDKELVKRHKK